MDTELEYIKLKVDWYKSLYPWNLAIIVGSVTFGRFVSGDYRELILSLIIVSVVFFANFFNVA